MFLIPLIFLFALFVPVPSLGRGFVYGKLSLPVFLLPMFFAGHPEVFSSGNNPLENPSFQHVPRVPSHVRESRDAFFNNDAPDIFSYTPPYPRFGMLGVTGNLLYSEKLLSLPMKDGTSFPVFVQFDSMSNLKSLIFGYGWRVSLLDSIIYLDDERSCVCYSPDGQKLRLFRSSDGRKFVNNSGWTARQNGKTTLLESPHGYTATYTSGRISSLQMKNGSFFRIVRTGDCFRVVDGNSILLTILSPKQTLGEGVVSHDGKEIKFENKLTSLVTSDKGKPVVRSLPSLAEMTFHEKSKRKYNFHYIPSSERMSLDVLQGEKRLHEFSWNAKNGHLIWHNRNTYDVMVKKNEWEGWSIKRTDEGGRVESQVRDNVRGFEEEMGKDGTKVRRTWFLFGPAAGLVREVAVTAPDGKTWKSKNLYDPNGFLVKKTRISNP